MKAITQYLQRLGYTTAKDTWYNLIELWARWYRGKVPSVHCYSTYNGRKSVRRTRQSLGMAKAIAEDWANLLLNERVTITVEQQQAQEQLEQVLLTNGFWSRGNQLIEQTMALGTGALVEFLDADGAVKIDYVRAGMIYPLTWDNGRITECAFASERAKGRQTIVYLNIHRLEAGRYVVENHLFERNGSSLRELELPEDLEPEVRTGSSVPRFQILSPNIANNLDPDSPMGISVYANALDQLAATDLVFDSYCNEFRLGKKRIIVPQSMTRMEMEKDGTFTPTFDDNDVEFYSIPQEQGQNNKIDSIDPELRAEAHDRGMQMMLNLDSWKCGFGTRRYIFQDGQVKTATEVVSNNSDLYRNLRKHELLLRQAITGLVEAIGDMLSVDMGAVTVTFDDSIIEDAEKERLQDIQDVRDSIMASWEYRAKWYGEDPETAKAAVAELGGPELTFRE